VVLFCLFLLICAQIGGCREALYDALCVAILKWEHKLIKTFVKQFAIRGGIAAGVGIPIPSQGRNIVYFRTVECGVLSTLGKQFLASAFPDCAIEDVLLTQSDIGRLTAGPVLHRSKMDQQAKESFLSFLATAPPTVAAYLCIVNQKGIICLNTQGLQHKDGKMRDIAQTLVKSPVADERNLHHLKVPTGSCTLSLQQQLDIVNSIPAQHITVNTKESRSHQPLYVAWPNLSPKSMLLCNRPSPVAVYERYRSTCNAILTPRTAPPSHSVCGRKRRRSCSTHHLFLRRLASAASSYTERARLQPGLSQHTFAVTMSPTETFQSAIASQGFARVVTFTDTYFEIIWNKFDPVKS
jgi:hypothetical protein